MADKKISALTASTTPLAGSEVLPIVQGGATVKVSAANITAGRAVSVGSLTPTTAPATQWAIDGTDAGLLISIADNATYDLASGSGVIYLWDNGGNGIAAAYTFYGTVALQYSPQGLYTTTQGTATKINLYYNAGTNSYRLENLTGSAKSIYIFAIKLRAAT